jgi:hypothetical protein
LVLSVPHISVIDPQNRPTLLGLTETHIDLSSVCGSIFEAHSVETRKRPANRPAGNDRSYGQMRSCTVAARAVTPRGAQANKNAPSNSKASPQQGHSHCAGA